MTANDNRNSADWEPRLAAHAAGESPFKFARTETAPQRPNWRRSSFHKPTKLGDCVEVYRYGDGVIGVQDARYHGQQGREGLAKLFSPEAWTAFVAGVKAGEFDFTGVPSDGN